MFKLGQRNHITACLMSYTLTTLCMKKTLCLCVALLVIFASFAAKAPLSIDQKQVPNSETSNLNSLPDEGQKKSTDRVFSQLTLKDLQTSLGRKLTLQEKISWLIFKKRLPRIEPTESEKAHANSNAVLGFVFGLLGLIVFPLLAIPGLILSNKALLAERVDPGILKSGNRGLAVAGQITSYIALALLIIVVILLVAFLSNWH